jgi:hypothetical protein
MLSTNTSCLLANNSFLKSSKLPSAYINVTVHTYLMLLQQLLHIPFNICLFPWKSVIFYFAVLYLCMAYLLPVELEIYIACSDCNWDFNGNFFNYITSSLLVLNSFHLWIKHEVLSNNPNGNLPKSLHIIMEVNMALSILSLWLKEHSSEMSIVYPLLFFFLFPFKY